MQRKSSSIDLTRGEPMKLLILFAIPMLIGSVFQLMYNMVDSAVLGRFVSKNALAEKRFIYILIDGDFIRTKTRSQVLIIHISGQNSPYDMKTAVLAYVNVQ